MRYAITKKMSFAVGAKVHALDVEIRYVLDDQDPGDPAIIAVSVIENDSKHPAPWLERLVATAGDLRSEMIRNAREKAVRAA